MAHPRLEELQTAARFGLCACGTKLFLFIRLKPSWYFKESGLGSGLANRSSALMFAQFHLA